MNDIVTIPSPFKVSDYDYCSIYTSLRGSSLSEVLLLGAFDSIQTSPEISIIDSARQADCFFERFGVGNLYVGIDRPFERFRAYELLLGILAGHNKSKYKQIHKGIPYYFLGWTAFQIENYGKGIYYIDQAIAEDVKKSETQDMSIIRQNPAVRSFLLDPQSNSTGVAMDLVLRGEMDATFQRFTSNSGADLDTNTFVEKFILGSGDFLSSEFRTIVTCMYSFVLEYHTLVTALKLRSGHGGSLEPFFLHLFKGSLLLESILKLKCPQDTLTIGDAISFLGKRLLINAKDYPRKCTLTQVVQYAYKTKTGEVTFQNRAFGVAYGIRNTTGHKLTWSDVFRNDVNVYDNLYYQTLNAILWSIYKLWAEEA